MILNVGCGDDRHTDAVNIDIRGDCWPDVVAPAEDLPYEDGSVIEIRAFDVLEHTTDPTAFLKEWRRVLADGGLLKLRVPNLAALGAQIATDVRTDRVRLLIRNVYGGHRWGEWDVHHWGWTPKTLAEDLEAAGFRVTANNEALNMEVEAVREP